MRKKLILTVFVCISALMASAQLSAENFFVSFSSTFYTDFVKTPVTFHRAVIGSNPDPIDPNITVPVYADVPYQSAQLSTYSFGVEPRYNIQTINDNAAIAIAMPISFGIGSSFSANDDVNGLNGLGSIQVPLLAKFYYGNGSTYNTEKDFGVSFGGGIEYNRIGLFNPDDTDKELNKHKSFILPVASASVHFWRGTTPFEVNIKYGATKTVEYRLDRNGQILTDELNNPISRSSKGSSFKLTFLYLLNY